MTFFFSGVFWGAILILIGINMILKHVFNIDLPIVRIVFAGIIILFGLQLLLGKPDLLSYSDSKTVIFHEKSIDQFPENSADQEFSTVFGRSVISLSSARIPEAMKSLKINTVFGNTELRLDPGMSYSIKTNSAFAGVMLPNGTVSALGSAEYSTPVQKSSKIRHLDIEINAVFAGVFVKEKDLDSDL
jgi:hypothetical protein